MRPIFLLIALLFCLDIQAKEKVYTPAKQMTGVRLSTTVNTGLNGVNGNRLSSANEVLNPTRRTFTDYGTYYFDTNFANFGEGYGFRENSYKNVEPGNRIPSGASKTVTPSSNDASMESQIVFRRGLYFGFALMLVLLNLVCFFLFEEKAFLYYSAALATMSLLLFYSDGLFELLQISTVDNPLLVTTLLTFFAISFGAIFASKYLTLKEFLPKFKHIGFGLVGIAMLLLATGWITSNPAFLHGANAVLFTVAVTYFMAGVYLFSKKNYAKFFVIATFIPLLFCIDFFVLSPMGITFLSAQTAHIKAASIAEMLIITYAIMYRMQAIKEENILRQAELRIFLKRQEVHTARMKTEKLVEDLYLENLIMHYDLDGLEIKLLQYISEGKDNAKIARKLKTSEHDVEELTKELYEKLEIGEQIQQDYRLVDSQPDYIYN
ncbi:MAG: 7TM diverse intracellular signaling domain-containing protein [Bacteroidota bacterium]